MNLDVRKIVLFREEVHSEGGRRAAEPLCKVAAAAVVANPLAGRPYREDLEELVAASATLGGRLGNLCRDALDGRCESHGKAAAVGGAGEVEHASAVKTNAFADPFRTAIGGSKAWIPSVVKRCAPGAPIDVPLCFGGEVWVRSHYDTITVAIPDAPAGDEIVVIGAAASRGRLNHRLGGRTKEEALHAPDTAGAGPQR